MFKVDKYVDIAYGNVRGKEILSKVEANWSQWSHITESSEWSRFYGKRGKLTLRAPSPKGTSAGSIAASDIFAAAVWGYGFDKWTARQSAECVERLRGTKSFLWYYPWLVEGIYVPQEFAQLDLWLESLLAK